MSPNDEPTSTTRDESHLIDGTRRQFLRTATATVAGGAILQSAVGSASADTDEIMEVDLRGGIPPASAAPQGEDEVIFNVHGYTGSSFSVSQSATLRDTLRQLGNTETVTAVTWDDSGLPTSAEASARDQGADFADWMEDYIAQNPGTTIRILGHSMGGIVTYEFLAAADGRFRVANADTIGSYEVSDAPCEGSEFHGAIENVANFVGNYYSTNDSIARLGGGPADCGFGGGSLPDNYEDVDVSDSVSGHTVYKQSTGFGQAYLSNFAPPVDRGDDGDDGDDGDNGDGNQAPVVDSLDASEAFGWWNDDIDAEWSVSDPNGDLSTVRTALLTSSGTVIDSTRTNVSGSSASGEHTLDPPWYASEDAVRIIVRDQAGNVTRQETQI